MLNFVNTNRLILEIAFFCQVDYATALDIFIVLCFVSVFAALIEFALLNFLDTLVRRIKRKEQENKSVQKVTRAHL